MRKYQRIIVDNYPDSEYADNIRINNNHKDFGIGGFALAAQWAGFETIGFSEVDPYACKILNQHWPHVKNYGDIRKIKGSEIGTVELVTGDFLTH